MGATAGPTFLATTSDSGQYPNPFQEFKDKVVVVLGGASGIGLDAARAYWEQGAQVYIVGLMPISPSVSTSDVEARRAYVKSAVGNLQNSMPETTGPARHQVRFVECNVREETTLDQSLATGDKLVVQQRLRDIAAQHGRIDVIADTIGWRPQFSPEKNDLTPALLQEVMAVNAGYLPFVLSGEFIAPLMKESETGGRILIVGSTLPDGNINAAAGPYAAAKSARISAASTAAASLGRFGIGVVILSPGHVDNDAERAALGVAEAAQVEARAIARRHIQVALTGRDVAAHILIYTMDAAKHLNGQNIRIGAAGSKIMPTLSMHGEEWLEASARTSKEFVVAMAQMMGHANVQIATLAVENGALTATNTDLQTRLDEMHRTIEGLASIIADRGLAHEVDVGRHGIHAVRSVRSITERHPRHHSLERGAPAGTA